MKHYFAVFISLITLTFLGASERVFSDESLRNPLIPGYFADPSLVQHEDKFYLYATVLFLNYSKTNFGNPSLVK